MDDQEIFEKIVKIVANKLEVEEKEVKGESNFITDLEGDSLDTVEIVVDIENEFRIKISDAEAENISTTNEAMKKVKEKLAT